MYITQYTIVVTFVLCFPGIEGAKKEKALLILKE